MENFERIILVKSEVFVFRLPPRQSNRGYRAADWSLDNPDWTGKMRLVEVNNELIMKLEDKSSGQLFAKCPIESYPGVAIEAVLDSSRYFVIRLKDDSGKMAFIGLGFTDRNDSFDMNVTIQDYFKKQEAEENVEEEGMPEESEEKLNLGFKEGQTIKLNLQTKRSGDSKSKLAGLSSKSNPNSGGGLGLLPPPPSKPK